MIDLSGINKTYQVGGKPLQVLRDIDLHLDSGDYISVMGPSGSGKSTLLNIIGLLDRADSGSYRLAGSETQALSEEQRAVLRRKHIGFIFQSFYLINRLTAFENVELPLVLAGMLPKERRPLVSEALAMLDMSNRSNHLPNQLSGGQLQRVAIARAVVMQPKILLADEPTGNLDQRSGHEVIKVMERLNSEGITLMIVTHDVDLGNRAHRAIRMVDGEIVSDGGGKTDAPG